MPDIYFNCAACENPLVVDATGAGLTLLCPICNVAIIIPINSTHKSTPRAKSDPGMSSSAKSNPRHCPHLRPATDTI